MGQIVRDGVVYEIRSADPVAVDKNGKPIFEKRIDKAPPKPNPRKPKGDR